jgi:DNA helicase-2/ATP-dependent DNA helicase PcrA
LPYDIDAIGIDDEKKPAIRTTEGPLLIIAGPGSGKTRTLVERAIHLVAQGVAPERILVATFTEKAASELITRISNRLLALDMRVSIHEMYVGTLHSIFLRILDEHHEFTRLRRNYRVLDQFDQRYLIFRKIRQLAEAPGVADLLNIGNTSNWVAAETAVAYVNKVSEELLDVARLKAAPEPPIAAIGHLYDAYQKLLETENALDFSTIQVECHNLLAARPEILEKLQEQLRYLMIDEYQDTNTVQEKILLLLAARHSNLCVVGDDDQGLYRFRGATIRNILEFEKNFPPGKCATVKLTTNYRSHPQIIETYNRWMRQTDWSGDFGVHFRFPKEIKPEPNKSFPDTAAVVRVSSEGSVLDYHQEVLAFIHHLRAENRLGDLNQIAFLFKSVKSDRATQLASFLEENGVPVFSPRSAQFFERPETQLIMGAMIFIFPNLFELLKWDDDAKLDVWDYYEKCKTVFADAVRADRKTHAGLLDWCNKKARTHLTLTQPTNYRFSELMYELFQFPMFSNFLNADLKANSHDLRPTYNLALFSQLLTKFEYLHNVIVIVPDSIQRDLQDLFNRFFRFLIEGGMEEYEDFEVITPPGCVSFMTIHQSKGLEFPVTLVGSLDAVPRKQYDDIDVLLQNRYYHKPPFEPLERTKTFDFWRLYYTAFSRTQNLLGLITLEERGVPNKKNPRGKLIVPREYFSSVYHPLPHWRSSAFDVTRLEFAPVKAVNLKHQYSFTSHVLLYENCPLQYKFFKELEFASVRQSGPMAGTIIHQTIEDIHRAVLRGDSSTITDTRIDTWFHNNYRSLSQATRTYLTPNVLQSLLSQIIRYKDRHQNDWHRIREAEVDVSLVKEDYILEGTIDLIRSDDSDTVELMDFKSGPKPDLNAAADRALLDRYRRQLEVYAHLVEERTDVKVSRMHLYYTAEKDGIPTVTYERGRANVEKTIASFATVVAKIEAKNFDMSHITKSEKLCGNCDMRHHCNPVYPTTSTRA